MEKYNSILLNNVLVYHQILFYHASEPFLQCCIELLTLSPTPSMMDCSWLKVPTFPEVCSLNKGHTTQLISV
jgi:hypothetical protein